MDKFYLNISRLCMVIFLLLTLAACNLPLRQTSELAAELLPKAAGAWIDAPLNGAEAPPGIPITVIGHVDPSVGQAILYINDVNSSLPSAPILNKKPPAYQWEWVPDTPGVYFLRVGGSDGPLSNPVKVTVIGDMSFSATFRADQDTLKLGDCTVLHWTTENARNVQLDGEEVDLEGNQEICPQQDQTHVLHVQYKDISSEDLIVNLIVVVDTPTPTITITPTPTSTKKPTLTPTVTITLTQYVLPVVTTTVPPPTDTIPPSAPLRLSPCGSQKSPTLVNSPVNLTWLAVKDTSGISQYKISVLNLNSQKLSEFYTSTPPYTLTIEEATYAWQVSAQDGAGNWGPFSELCYFYYAVLR